MKQGVMGRFPDNGGGLDIAELRMREDGLRIINDVIGPEIGVKNALMRRWMDTYGDKTLAWSEAWMSEWISRELRAVGYARISNNQAFSRLHDGMWAKEYKVIPTE